MSVSKVTRSVVTFADGRLGMQVLVDGQVYANLVSDIQPKTQEEINTFISNIVGETTVTKYPEDTQPLEDVEKKANVARAIYVAKEILGKIADLPERAAEYATSVEEKTGSILSWIEEKDHVTDKQLGSLENMNLGVDKWLN